MLFLKLHTYLSINKDGRGKEDYLQQAIQYLKEPLLHPQGRRHTFLCGDAGPLALGAYIYHKIGDERSSLHCISK